ncbi:hypothetical protein FRC00_011101, partial [Tulasnella sp. 408]
MSSPISELRQLPILDGNPDSGTSTPLVVPTLNGDNRVGTETTPQASQSTPRDLRFWMVITSMMVAEFLSAIELSSVATALPTIVEDLHGTEFSWVGAAYALGGMAQIFGRRPVLLGSIALFALGSGICGGASNMNMLIAGRAVQGVGGGGIMSISNIVLADM